MRLITTAILLTLASQATADEINHNLQYTCRIVLTDHVDYGAPDRPTVRRSEVGADFHFRIFRSEERDVLSYYHPQDAQIRMLTRQAQVIGSGALTYGNIMEGGNEQFYIKYHSGSTYEQLLQLRRFVDAYPDHFISHYTCFPSR